MRARPTALGTAVAVLALALGCGGDRPPRKLPFPAFHAEALFPDLAEAEGTRSQASKESLFERSLGGAGGAAAEQKEPPRQSVPLVDRFSGDLPGGLDASSWTWSNDSGATLVVHRISARADALIYAEVFSAEMASHPSEEIRRFERTVVPDLVDPLLDWRSVESLLDGSLARRVSRGTGLNGPQAGRLLQLLATRTAGRGLGFHPGPERDSGWRWVGRNRQGITVRMSRFPGIWGRQRSLPADLAKGLPRLAQAAPELAKIADWLFRPPGASGTAPPEGPAYLWLGSVTDEHEMVGAHLALICVQTPQCSVAADLAAFLGSLRIVDPGSLKNPEGGAHDTLAELARREYLEILPAELTLPPDFYNAGPQMPPRR